MLHFRRAVSVCSARSCQRIGNYGRPPQPPYNGNPKNRFPDFTDSLLLDPSLLSASAWPSKYVFPSLSQNPSRHAGYKYRQHRYWNHGWASTSDWNYHVKWPQFMTIRELWVECVTRKGRVLEFTLEMCRTGCHKKCWHWEATWSAICQRQLANESLLFNMAPIFETGPFLPKILMRHYFKFPSTPTEIPMAMGAKYAKANAMEAKYAMPSGSKLPLEVIPEGQPIFAGKRSDSDSVIANVSDPCSDTSSEMTWDCLSLDELQYAFLYEGMDSDECNTSDLR